MYAGKHHWLSANIHPSIHPPYPSQPGWSVSDHLHLHLISLSAFFSPNLNGIVYPPPTDYSPPLPSLQRTEPGREKSNAMQWMNEWGVIWNEEKRGGKKWRYTQLHTYTLLSIHEEWWLSGTLTEWWGRTFWLEGEREKKCNVRAIKFSLLSKMAFFKGVSRQGTGSRLMSYLTSF